MPLQFVNDTHFPDSTTHFPEMGTKSVWVCADTLYIYIKICMTKSKTTTRQDEVKVIQDYDMS